MRDSIEDRLEVFGDGLVRVTLQRPRANGHIGTFEFTLPQEDGDLLGALEYYGFRQMLDVYGPGAEDDVWVEITVRRPTMWKRVKAYGSNYAMPRGLCMLFSLDPPPPGYPNAPPGGVLSELVEMASEHPKAAIEVKLEVPKRVWQVGESIPVAVVIRNVGTAPVALPSQDTTWEVVGGISVYLGRQPAGAEEMAETVRTTDLGFGPRPVRPGDERPEVAGVKVIPAGSEWRLRLPPLGGIPEAGRYQLTASARWTALRREALWVALEGGATPIVGEVRLEPVDVSVVDQ
jgi:hypothetical protein